MKKTASRPERRLLRIAHQLKARSRSVALLYLDTFQGDHLGLSAETSGGFVGLHIDQRQKRTGIELLCTSSSGASALAADLADLELPRKPPQGPPRPMMAQEKAKGAIEISLVKPRASDTVEV